MDYLDPQKKKAHRIRLYIGYGLFAIAIGLATIILVYLANGYYVDRSTGEVIQNGLVFVDSNPGSADIYLNGEKQRGKTDARIVIPGGTYDIEMKRSGYRDWSRTLILEGGSLRRLTYARLLPSVLSTTASVTFRSQPIDTIQSIDKKWLLSSHQDQPLLLTLINLDSAINITQTIEIPADLVTSTGGVTKFVEWSQNSRYILVSYEKDGKTDYIQIDREQPSNTINLSDRFTLDKTSTSLEFRDGKENSFYVFNKSTKLLTAATVSNGISDDPFVRKKLLAYQTYSDNWLLYVSESGEKGLVDVWFKNGDNIVKIKQLKTSEEYLLELAKLENYPVMAIASKVENRAVVYNDPESYLKENEDAKLPIAATVLRLPGIKDITISTDASVVLGYGDELVASHEFQADRSYSFKLDQIIDEDSEPRWIDGQHLTYSVEAKQFMVDFDGSNKYELATSVPNLGSYYSNQLDVLFTFDSGRVAGENTPASSSRLKKTSLLATQDK